MNEEGNIPLLCDKIAESVDRQRYDIEIILVDDGSTDHTLDVIKVYRAAHPYVHFISFSRNFGHQQALKAGIDFAAGDAIIMMDADLQHPPELIGQMIDKWAEGYDVVYTMRNDEKTGYLKRKTSRGFYALINKLSDTKIEEGSADFRLLDKKLVKIIASLNDPYLFLRGLIPWMGFKQYKITYTPNKRHSGQTKYSFRKMFRFAITGITSFSVKPLHFATVFGLIISMLAFMYGVYAICVYFFYDQVVTGWASLLTSVLFIGGIQLIMLGIIGEYIGKLYIQVKNRPNYIISDSSLVERAESEAEISGKNKMYPAE